MGERELLFKEFTHKIIGCALETLRVLGPGFQEYIYQRALAIELKAAGIKFEEEFEIPIYYKGEKSVYAELISGSIKQFP